MSHRYRWPFLLTACCLALAVLMQAPQWIHMASPAYRGIPVRLNADEQVYMARVEETMAGRPEQAGEAFVGDPKLLGAQQAFLEQAEGMLFAGTGWRPWTIFQVMDSIIPPLLFLTLWFFLLRCGFDRTTALVGAGLFCVLELYNLNRPVYQRTSFLLELLALLGLMRGLEARRWWGIAGGALLGILIGVYFWAWTFAWLWWGILLCWEAAEAWHAGRSRVRLSRLAWLLFFGFVGVLFGLGFLDEMLRLSHQLFYDEAVFRSGIHPSHLPESWIYSLLFLCMAGGIAGAAARMYAALRPYRYAVVTVLAGFVALNQQVLHGKVFMFASHYLFALILSAVITLLLAWQLRLRPRWLLLPFAAAAIYLAAIGYDGRHVLDQYGLKAADFSEQHFATLLPVLDALPRSRILTDADTSLFLAGATKHDVVYTIYLKNVLMSHEDMARRYCATIAALPEADWHLADRPFLLWPDADSAYRKDPSVRRKEVAIVDKACAEVASDPAAALRGFAVQYVLWDRQRQPRWDLRRLKVPLVKIAEDEGWSLWRL